MLYILYTIQIIIAFLKHADPMFARCLSGQGMKNAKVLQNCKQGAEQGVVKFQGKFRMGAYLNMFHAVTCQKQNEIT